MEKITILDTSIATSNLGDEIIVEAVNKQLNLIFTKDMFLRVPTHEYLGRQSRRILNQSKFEFVAGTNLLNSHFNFIRSNSWKLKLSDAFRFNDFILLGVGWGEYQDSVSILSKFIYKRILNTSYLHSVRDSYTKNKLESIGIYNVLNTGCATMWDLTPKFCVSIPEDKASNVIFTITDYCKDFDRDQKLINVLNNNYENVYCWIQGSKDYDYLKSLDNSKVIIVPPKLSSYDQILESGIDIDYVGTRLHAGIRAMQKGKRSVIIGIDNRALEKKKDFNINLINRKEIQFLPEVINNKIKTDITLDFNAINTWKNQFKVDAP